MGRAFRAIRWDFHLDFRYAEMERIAGAVNPVEGAGGNTFAVRHVVTVVRERFPWRKRWLFAHNPFAFDHVAVAICIAQHPAATSYRHSRIGEIGDRDEIDKGVRCIAGEALLVVKINKFVESGTKPGYFFALGRHAIRNSFVSSIKNQAA